MNIYEQILSLILLSVGFSIQYCVVHRLQHNHFKCHYAENLQRHSTSKATPSALRPSTAATTNCLRRTDFPKSCCIVTLFHFHNPHPFSRWRWHFHCSTDKSANMYPILCCAPCFFLLKLPLLTHLYFYG